MKEKEFLEEIRRNGMSTINILPSGYDYSVSQKTLTLKLTKKGVCDNMQKDPSAFESWALVLKCYCPKLINNVIIDWEDPEEKDEHFNRFVYRLTRFVQNYEWASAAKPVPSIPALLFCSAPNKNTEGISHYEEYSEDWLECKFVERESDSYDAIDHQLPVGLFDGVATNKSRFSPAYNSQIDIWAIRGAEFSIFELKKAGNKPLGIISELMFYTNVVCDILHHNILIDENKAQRAVRNRYRGFDTFYEVYSGKRNISKLRAVFLAKEFHSLFNDDVLELINQSTRLKRYNIRFEKEDPFMDE